MHPLAPFADLLRSAFRERRPSAQARGLASWSPELVHLVPELRDKTEEIEATQQRHDLFEAIASFLAAGEDEVPLFVVLEDLHWADNESLELLVFLARRLRGKRVLLAGTYRSDAVSPRLQTTVESLRRSLMATSVEVSPLSQAETEDLIRHLRNGRPVRPDVALTLHELTDGNPLFLEEVVRSLGPKAEALHDDRGQTRLPLAVLQPPASVREAVRRRVSTLTEEATRVLDVAAVAGRRFDFDLLRALTGITEEALIAILRELVVAQLVVEESPDRFTFLHALTQQAVYTGLLTRERRQVHERVARFLLDASVPADAGELAHHFFEARSWPEAARYSEAAGQRALTLFSPQAAAKHLTRALEASANAGEEPDWRTVWLRARAFDTLGDFTAAKDDYERAAAIAGQSGDRLSVWQALLDLGLLWAASNYDEARRHFDQCLDLAKELGDGDVVARTLNRAANSSVNAYRLDKAVDMHAEALRLAEATGNPQLLAECRDLLGMASFQSGDLRGADVHYARAIAAWRALDDRHGLSSSLAMRALSGGGVFTDTEAPRGRSWDDRLRDANEALELAVASGWAPGEAFARCVLAWIAVPVGQYQLAWESASRALSLAEAIGHRQWTVAALCAFGRVHAALLDLDHASQLLDRGWLLARDLSSPLWVCNLGSSLVDVEVARGRLDAATEVMRQIGAHEVDERALHARGARAAQARLALAAGDPASSLRLCEDLLSKAAGGNPRALPRLLMLKGEALTALGRKEQARGVLEVAVETSREQGNRNLLWQACVALGRAAPGASRRAPGHGAVEEARTILAELAEGIADLAARQRFMNATENSLPAAPRPTPRQAAKTAFGGLTEREREVATLVAQGLTNPAIASRLVVGNRTIEVHVSHILDKLQLSTRAQIAAWAVTSGLIGDDNIRTGERQNLSVVPSKIT